MEVGTEAAAEAAPPGRSPAAPPLSVLQDRVRRLSSGVDPDAAAARAALLLLAGLYLEHNVVKLARYMRLEVEFVARCARRLVDNGIWSSGQTVRAWSPEGAGREAFWADVAVAEGKLCRRLDEEGRPQWAPGGHWWKSFDLIRTGEAGFSVVYHSPPELTSEVPSLIDQVADDEDADDERSAGDEIATDTGPAPMWSDLSSAEEALPLASRDEVSDGDDSEEGLAVHVSSDRPSSRDGSRVDLFPDAVWL